jgi:hypothetical protein
MNSKYRESMYKREWKLEDRRKNEELTDRWIYRFSVGRRGNAWSIHLWRT